MSSYLWKAYLEDDVDIFRHLLEAATSNARQHGVKGGGSQGFAIGSPGGLSTSPILLAKTRKVSGFGTPGGNGAQGISLTKADINWKDANGATLLHHAASSTADNAVGFVTALLEHPLIDLYAQDHESGWTALHRAFYHGNISIARIILEREADDMLGRTTGVAHHAIGLIKIKDREGFGPLDLYAATIRDRTLRPEMNGRNRSGSDASDEVYVGMDNEDFTLKSNIEFNQINGDEVYTFGSNRNVSLGFGDEDDRQYPERITLRRPESLVRRFHKEQLEQREKKWAAHDPGYVSSSAVVARTPIEEIPWIVRTTPLMIQDVHMAKLNTAVLTTDPESNLYVCGHGQGGRLGLGDERTRYHFTCVQDGALAGKKIATVALGQDHTLAITDEGEIFSWGNNAYGQLGYSLPKSSSSDEDPISTTPRQIFGTLKRETVVGIAASRIHSVAFTDSSLFTFGKNEGQLGIVDSDARSLEVQTTPRKVAASLFTSSIANVSAIDKATVCLLENFDVWVFASYGYVKVAFPLEGFSNYFLKQSFLVTSYDTVPNRIIKVTSGGDTVCALSSRGEVFTLSISPRAESQASSTTNPAKIRSAISHPQCIWSLKKGNMAARDVSVDADGSIILTTEEGSVWQRTRRNKIKSANITVGSEYKPKDYKFSRISGLTRVLAARSSAYGAYAAVRRDCDVTKTQVVVEDSALWKDVSQLFALREFASTAYSNEDHVNRPRFWQSSRKPDEVQTLKRAILESKDIEADLKEICERSMADDAAKYDAVLTTTTSDLKIPVHRFLLTSRSRVFRRGFRDLCEASTFTIPDLAVSDLDKYGRVVVKFQALDILTVIDFALYLYTDTIIDFWHVHNAQHLAFRYRQVRAELMKVASKLELVKLEPAVRQMITPTTSLDMDLEIAYKDAAFFYDGDIVVQLEDDEVRVHSVLVCARCPFFEGLFMGRAGGRWLAGRDTEEDIQVDLSHVSAKSFEFVLRYIYADTGTELFDDVASADQDEFLDIVMDVLSAANELMLDRLSQICQSVIGRFVNARNVCWLLNAISPSSVHEFKHAGLEYLCLNLEAMLQGHYLNELDEDLLEELDEIVRQNQLACMPFAKSGRAELNLHERHPDLAAIIERNKRAKIDSVRLRTKYQDINAFAPGSIGEDVSQSPLQQKPRRRSSQIVKAVSDRPSLKAMASTKDMMFAMDEEADSDSRSPGPSPAIRPMATPSLNAISSSPPAEEQWYNSRGKALASPNLRPQQSSTPGIGTPQIPRSPHMTGSRTPQSSGVPWSATPLAGARSTDLKDIMAQASSNRTSSLSQGLASASFQSPSPLNLPAPKVSQKDRKKLMQQQQTSSPSSLNLFSVPKLNDSQSTGTTKGSPWQTVSAHRVPSLKDVIDVQKSTPPRPVASPATRTSSTPQLTMRQTVSNAKSTPPQKPIVGPAGSQSPHQHRSVPFSGPKPGTDTSRPSPRQQTSRPPKPQPTSSKPIPHSIRHQPLSAEPNLLLSMQDIVALQQAEKDVIKEAAAKRDLQDIQAEQEFQEWWDKESARVQEAETLPPKAPKRQGGRGRGGSSRGGGRGGKAKVGGAARGGGS